MTIGSRFLTRVLTEAEDRDGIKDNFNVPLDSQARALAAKLKLPLAKRLVAFHAMCGVPGRYLNSEDAESAIISAADLLRKKVAVRRAFLSLYDGLANAKGFTIPETMKEEKRTREDVEDDIKALDKKIVQAGKDGTRRGIIIDMEKKLTRLRNELKTMREELELDEAKSDAKRMAVQDPEKIMKAKEAVKKAKKALADHNKHYDGGTGARAKALQAEIDKAQAKLKKLTEEFELNEAKQKRGSFIQKLLESVMVELGLPETLITTAGPSAVGTGIYKTAELIEQDSTLERSLRLLATRLGINANDAQGPVNEAVNVGNDDYANAVVNLVAALGIPDVALTARRPQVVQSLRRRKSELRNRTAVLTMMSRLENLLSRSAAPGAGEPEEPTPTNEAKSMRREKPKSEPGWYIVSKDGDQAGPYKSKEVAEKKAEKGDKVRHYSYGELF